MTAGLDEQNFLPDSIRCLPFTGNKIEGNYNSIAIQANLSLSNIYKYFCQLFNDILNNFLITKLKEYLKNLANNSNMSITFDYFFTAIDGSLFPTSMLYIHSKNH